MSRNPNIKKRKAFIPYPEDNSGSERNQMIFSASAINQIKSSIRGDLEVLYQKQIEEFRKLHTKLEELQQQVNQLQKNSSTPTHLSHSPHLSNSAHLSNSTHSQSKVDSVFQSYLT